MDAQRRDMKVTPGRTRLNDVLSASGDGIAINFSNQPRAAAAISHALSRHGAQSLICELERLSVANQTKHIFLDLSGNNLETKVFADVDFFFKVTLASYGYNLRSIKLSHNKITDDDCLTLIQLIAKQEIPVEEVDLECNLITDVGALTIMAGFARMRQMYPFHWRNGLCACMVKLSNNLIGNPLELSQMLTSHTSNLQHVVTSNGTSSRWGVLRTPPGMDAAEMPSVVLHQFMVQKAQSTRISASKMRDIYDAVQIEMSESERGSLVDIRYSAAEMLRVRHVSVYTETMEADDPCDAPRWSARAQSDIDRDMYKYLLRYLKDLQRRFTQYPSGGGKKEHKVKELICLEMRRAVWMKRYSRIQGKLTEQTTSLEAGWIDLMQKAHRGHDFEQYRDIYRTAINLANEPRSLMPKVKPEVQWPQGIWSGKEMIEKIVSCRDVVHLWSLLDIARKNHPIEIQELAESRIRKLTSAVAGDTRRRDMRYPGWQAKESRRRDMEWHDGRPAQYDMVARVQFQRPQDVPRPRLDGEQLLAMAPWVVQPPIGSVNVDRFNSCVRSPRALAEELRTRGEKQCFRATQENY